MSANFPRSVPGKITDAVERLFKADANLVAYFGAEIAAKETEDLAWGTSIRTPSLAILPSTLEQDQQVGGWWILRTSLEVWVIKSLAEATPGIYDVTDYLFRVLATQQVLRDASDAILTEHLVTFRLQEAPTSDTEGGLLGLSFAVTYSSSIEGDTREVIL